MHNHIFLNIMSSINKKDGEPVGMTNDSGTSYFGTDILGSVRSVTDKYGAVQSSYDYDAFGSPYLGNLDNGMSFGYTGKAYDAGTGLYDYGFRDYSPNSARFTTVDPIRDGSNWFSYVVNDPVNYVDPFGLKSNDVKNYEYLGEWGGEKHYKAKSGATKWGLARDTGHDVKDVKGYDGDPTKMPIGTELSIPSNSGSTPSESTQITATPPNVNTSVSTQSVGSAQILGSSVQGMAAGVVQALNTVGSAPPAPANAFNSSIGRSHTSDEGRNFNSINIIKEIFDVFSLEFKAGAGVDLAFIDHLVQLDLCSLKGYLTTNGFSETYNSMGIGYGGLTFSAETTTIPAINDIFNPENMTISILGIELSQDGLDYKWTFGGQCVIGIYLNISLKESLDLLLKIGELNYEATHRQ